MSNGKCVVDLLGVLMYGTSCLQITLEDFTQYKDLPDQLPALLVVGTRVTGIETYM